MKNKLKIDNKPLFIFGHIVYVISIVFMIPLGTMWMISKMSGLENLANEYYMPLCISFYSFTVSVILIGYSLNWKK